jgi:lauroyl/myristoyl acyltransferase
MSLVVNLSTAREDTPEPGATGRPLLEQDEPVPPGDPLRAVLAAVARPLPIGFRRGLLYGLQRLQSRLLQLDPEWKAAQPAVKQAMRVALGLEAGAIEDVYRANLRNEDRRMADQLAALTWPAEISAWASVSAEDPIRALAQSSAGAVVALFHIGPYVLLAPVLAALGLNVHVIAVKESVGFWQTNWLDRDARRNIALIESNSVSSLRRAIRAVKSGGVVVVWCDLVTGNVATKHRTRFLGHDVWLPIGAAAIAASARAPVYPLVLDQRPNRYYDVRTLSVLPPPVAPTREAIVNTSVEVLRSFEGYVIKNPASWLSWQELGDFFVATDSHTQSAAPNGPS